MATTSTGSSQDAARIAAQRPRGRRALVPRRLPDARHGSCRCARARRRFPRVGESQVPDGDSRNRVPVRAAGDRRVAAPERDRLVRPRQSVRVRRQVARLVADREPVRQRHAAGDQRIRVAGRDGDHQRDRPREHPRVARGARPAPDRRRPLARPHAARLGRHRAARPRRPRSSCATRTRWSRRCASAACSRRRAAT